MLINTSRGKLIDTEAVIESLREKRLGSRGIDVYAEEEKLFFKDLSEMIIALPGSSFSQMCWLRLTRHLLPVKFWSRLQKPLCRISLILKMKI